MHGHAVPVLVCMAGGGLAAVVGRGGGDGLTLGFGIDELLAERRVLAVGDAGEGFAAAAEAEFHGFSVFTGEQVSAFEAAEGVDVVAVDVVVRGLGRAVVEVDPGGEEVGAGGIGEAGVDLGPGDAGRGVGVVDGDALATAHPAGRPGVGSEVVVEGGEEGVGGTLGAAVVEDGGLGAAAVSEFHEAEPVEVVGGEQGREGVVGEGDAPDSEGIVGGVGLGVGALGGDDQGGIVLDADFADGGPFFRGEGVGDPDDDVGVFGGLEVHPAKGVGLLGGQGRRGEEEDAEQSGQRTEGNDPHGSRYIRGECGGALTGVVRVGLERLGGWSTR